MCDDSFCMVDPVEREWDELAGIAEDAFAEVAPPKLVEAARIAESGAGGP